MAIRDRETRRSPQRRTPAPKQRARPAQRARPIAPVQQQRSRPVAPVQQQVARPMAPLPQAPALQPRAIAPTNQSLPRPVNPAIQQAIPMPAETDAFAQHPIPSVNGAFRENGMQNPNAIRPTTRSPQQKAAQQKMGILDNPPQAVQAPLVSPAGGEGRPAVQQDIAPVQQAAPRPLPQATPYQAPDTPDISSTTPVAPTDEPVIDQPQQDIAPVGQVEPRQVSPVPQVETPTPVTPTPQIGATNPVVAPVGGEGIPVAPAQDIAPVGQVEPRQVEPRSDVVPDPIVDPVTPTPEVGATDPIPPVPQVETPTLSVPKPIPSPTSSTPVSSNGGSIGLPEAPIYTPQPIPAPIVPDIQSGTTPSLPPRDTIGNGGTSPFQNPNIAPVGGITPPLGGGLPPVPPRGDITGTGGTRPTPRTLPMSGGVNPRIVGTTPTGTTPTAPDINPRPGGDIIGGVRGNAITGTGTGTGDQSWQNNSQAAGTGSAQNPYSSIYGGMQDPLAFLRGEGINIGDDYSRYFQGYDPAREQGAYQQYGLGQQAQMMGARAGLMGMTQQQGAGGFAGVGFGGAPASGMRGQFGLQQQQAGLGLRGDIYEMRRAQEEDWWTTLGRVEEARGEQFGMFGIGTGTEQAGQQADVIINPNVDPDTRGGGGAGLTFDYQGDTIPENPTVGQTWNIPAIGNVSETTVYFTGEPPPNDWVDEQTWKSEYGGGG